MKRKKWMVRLLSLLLVFGTAFAWYVKAEAAPDAGSRIIHVVYDDSGSMVKDGDGTFIERWSQAKYAMEVFSAMMSKQDIMNIYPMSKEGELGLTVRGSDVGRVKAVHDMNGRYRNTPFVTVTSAAEDLLKQDASYERWLVIITDGAFDDGATPTETVQQALDFEENMIPTVRTDLRSQILNHLHRLGIPNNLDGYQMLTVGLPLYMQDPGQTLSKELYPAIACAMGRGSSQTVERSVRQAIHAGWKHRDDRVWREYFMPDAGGTATCPNNKKFLTALLTRLQQETEE